MSDAGVIDGEAVEDFGVVGVSIVGEFENFDSVVVSFEGVEGESFVEEPIAVGGIDINGGFEFAQGVLPFSAVVKIVSIFDAFFGIGPVTVIVEVFLGHRVTTGFIAISNSCSVTSCNGCSRSLRISGQKGLK